MYFPAQILLFFQLVAFAVGNPLPSPSVEIFPISESLAASSVSRFAELSVRDDVARLWCPNNPFANYDDARLAKDLLRIWCK
jgi:hypothetical protein